MTFNQFKESLSQKQVPSDISELLKALWYDAKGDWHKAHEIAQSQESQQYCLVHAYLHRKEGDEWNAQYWYRRAKRNMPSYSLAEEWEKIVEELL
ncbi:hypothetical protein [Thermoflexibacter ruber]|uniref:Uncharacterized protein n=1 Tax=Thermoflexibacter ruber TaxID=1003 RepID=A0A1I2C8A9_9BACT|nr:hypothetical protein [Thermoflexibacter ruber]SFE64438.1 hypothetical protein SAMN04488541_1004130 [Thermoflexibacter ruber]